MELASNMCVVLSLNFHLLRCWSSVRIVCKGLSSVLSTGGGRELLFWKGERKTLLEERLFAFKLGVGLLIAVASIFLGNVAWKTCVDQASYVFSWASVKAADEKRALQLSKLCAACTEVVHGNRTYFSLDEHLANGSCSVL